MASGVVHEDYKTDMLLFPCLFYSTIALSGKKIFKSKVARGIEETLIFYQYGVRPACIYTQALVCPGSVLLVAQQQYSYHDLPTSDNVNFLTLVGWVSYVNLA